MPAKAIKDRWKNGEVTYSVSLKLGLPLLAEVAALTGFDIIKIDLEHGLNWQHMLMPMVQAVNGTGATTIVKIPKIDPETRRHLIGWVLDCGAEGIALAQTDTPAEALFGVSCMRHTPDGIRGVSSFYTKYLPGGKSRETICIAEIENATGAANTAKIAATPGIDGVTIGASDLAQSLNLPPSSTYSHTFRKGLHEDTALAIMKDCKEHGVAYGCTNDEGDEELKHLKSLGCQIINLGSDMGFLESGMKYAKGVLTSR